MADTKPSNLPAATVLEDEDIFIITQNSSGDSKKIVASAVWIPTNFIGGLTTSNGTDADHDIDIALGIARSADDTVSMRLAAVLTKQIDAAWSVGDDAGGLDTGSVAAGTLYAIWLIKRTDTGVVDALFSTSFTAPTMPANYTKKRLIAAVRTDAVSNIYLYVQSADRFVYTPASGDPTIIDVFDNTIVSGTHETGTLSVPPNCVGLIQAVATTVAAAPQLLRISIRPVGYQKLRPALSVDLAVGAGLDALDVTTEVLVDANRQMEYAITVSGGTPPDSMTIITDGFTMLTRREP